MAGRPPSGSQFVDRLEGSPEAKERAKGVLDALFGECSVPDACMRVGVHATRFDQLRQRLLQAMVDAAERRHAGRPAQTPTSAELENQKLRARIAELEAELQAALIRAELAATLPLTSEKKTAANPRRRGRPPKSKSSSSTI